MFYELTFLMADDAHDNVVEETFLQKFLEIFENKCPLATDSSRWMMDKQLYVHVTRIIPI